MNNIDLNDPLYDLFSTQEERDDYKRQKVYDIPIEQIEEFPNHPFQVKDDADMYRLAQSIKQNGVITPAIVRITDDPNRYQMISGHRRLYACDALGLPTIPCIKLELDDDAATILMVESNFNREKILPSEKAWSYKMRNEAMKRRAGRPKKDAEKNSDPRDPNLWTSQLLAQESDDSSAQIKRYIRLTRLIPDLMELIDAGRISVKNGAEIAFLSAQTQEWLCQWFHENGILKPDYIKTLREYEEEIGISSEDIFYRVMNIASSDDRAPAGKKVTIKEDSLLKYFPSDWSARDMKEQIMQLIKDWSEKTFGNATEDGTSLDTRKN